MSSEIAGLCITVNFTEKYTIAALIYKIPLVGKL
jgi:hypothetical protein